MTTISRNPTPFGHTARKEELARADTPRVAVRIFGVDFTSTPTRRKRIVVAGGMLTAGVLTLDRMESFSDWPGFEAW